ncbi:MAG: hypothetical protein WBQ44_22550 [Rhodococcus sp. (in: high G+C Gram-positive bacteria)]
MTPTLRSAVRSAAVGKASGFRSSVGIGTFLMTYFDGTHYERLATGVGVVAIAGELVADKLPSTPSRLIPPVLAGRIAAGAAGAYALARRAGDDQVSATLIGAVSAIAGSYAGYSYRGWASKRIAPLAAALVEDVAALAIGAAAVRDVREPW